MIPNSILLNLQTMKRKTMFGMLRRCVSSFCLKVVKCKAPRWLKASKKLLKSSKQNKTKQNKTKQNKTKRGKETFIIYYKKRDTMLQERSILRGRYQI